MFDVAGEAAGRHQCGTEGVGVCIQMDIQLISPQDRVCGSGYITCCNRYTC